MKSSLGEGDLWSLRAGVIVFGIYCVSFTFRPLIQKVFLDKSLRLIDVLYKQARFFTLMFVGTCCALIYPFYDLMPHHLYFTSISFFVALFSINETYISYTRVPFMLLTPFRRRLVLILMTNQVITGCLRIITDVIIFVFHFTGPSNEDLYIFIRAVRITSSISFALSELCVSKVTMDLISTPKSELNAEMRLQLKETKAKLQALATANMTGGVAAVIDIINSWLELQMTQGIVLVVGSATFIFYGHLFRLGLDDSERHGTSDTTRSSMTVTHNPSVPSEDKSSSSSIILSVSAV